VTITKRSLGLPRVKRQPWLVRLACSACVATIPVLGLLLSGSTLDPASASVVQAADDGPVATTLVAAPISLVATATTLTLTFSTRLTVTSTGAPVPGAAIQYYVHDPLPRQGPFPGLVCGDALTDANGVSTCSVNVFNIVWTLAPPGYAASFWGLPDFMPATAQGSYGL
jgi:hypothetical protein